MSQSDETEAIDCRHCGLPITRHEGIGGVQWRDNTRHSPSACFKARNLIHEPEPVCTHSAWLHIGSERYCATCGVDRDDLAEPLSRPGAS